MRIGIVGATGVVGRELLTVLADTTLDVSELRLSASSRSVGKSVLTPWGDITIADLTAHFFNGLDFCFFCVSSAVSREWIPEARKQGAICVDNSSAFRMEPEVPIIVPEVNGDLLKNRPGLIANPNCSAAQLTVALNPVQNFFGLEEVCISTYQAVTGAGQKALAQLEAELLQYPDLPDNPKRLLLNVQPFIGSCDESGHHLEEVKIIQETRKILNLPYLAMAVTAARVPVVRGHCQSVCFKTKVNTTAAEIRTCLLEADNVAVIDDNSQSSYPQPVTAQNTNHVYVGRIRENSFHCGSSFSMWVVADNLRKGAAHNALSIVEKWCALR